MMDVDICYLRLFRDPGDDIRIYRCKMTDGGKPVRDSYEYAGEVTWMQAKEGEPNPPLVKPGRLHLQALVDDLWDAGYRPSTWVTKKRGGKK